MEMTELNLTRTLLHLQNLTDLKLMTISCLSISYKMRKNNFFVCTGTLLVYRIRTHQSLRACMK